MEPTAYELVVVGTPNWGSSTSAPVRTFLKDYQGRLPQVAFFLTEGGKGHDAVFKDMAALVGHEPIARLWVTHDDVLASKYGPSLREFLDALAPKAAIPEAAPAVR